MSVDRKFLDIFWELSADDETKRASAVDKLINALKDKSNDVKTTYFTYSRQRLVKGLKSFEESSRISFENCLIRLLNVFPSETSTEELLQSMRVHVYSTEPSTKNERSSVKAAYLACPRVLCATDRMNEVDEEFAKIMIPPILLLTKSVHHRTAAYLTISEISTKAPKHLFDAALNQFLKATWNDMMSSNTSLTGDLLLVILSFQHRFKKRLQKLSIPLVDFSEKKYRRKLLFGILHSDDGVIVRLIDEVVKLNMLSDVWTSVKESLCSNINDTKNTLRFLQIVVHIVCNSGEKSAELAISKDVLDIFSMQLSDSKYKYFNKVSNLLKTMIKKVVDSANTDKAVCDSSTSNRLLELIVTNCPLFDFYCDMGAPRLCQIIFESAPLSLTVDTLQLFVKQLTDAFVNTEISKSLKASNGKTDDSGYCHSPDTVRLFVIKYVQIIMNTIMRFRYADSGKVFDEILNFLLTIGLAYSHKVNISHLKVPISETVGKGAWSAIFSTLDAMILQTAGNYKYSDLQVSKSISNLDVIKHFITLIKNGMSQCSKLTGISDNSPLNLDSLKQCLQLLQKVDSQDQLDQYVVILCAACSVFSLSMPHEDTVTLISDIIECRKKRLKNVVNESPHWSEVLTDVILSAISYPIRMLRSASRLTFKKMITEKVFVLTSDHNNSNISDGKYPSCLKLIGDILKTRPKKRTNSNNNNETKYDDEENSDESETEEDLVQFSTRLIESEQEESAMQISDSEETVDDKANNDDDDEVNQETSCDDDTSDDSDSDPLDDEVDIDEDELKKIKESVRAALGPAAMDCEEAETEFKEFTDAEMFARNEALAAAFRVHMQTPQRIVAEQARTLGQLKMRCFDLIECILQYCSEPQLLLPTLDLIIDISKGSIEYEMAKSRSDSSTTSEKSIVNQKQGKKKTSFIARYGDVPPLSRISHAVQKCHFRSQRTQSELVECLKDSGQQMHLQKLIKSFIDDAKLKEHGASTTCLHSVWFSANVFTRLHVWPNAFISYSHDLLHHVTLALMINSPLLIRVPLEREHVM
uniref:Uncharacterized protein n=1 Tax=Trichobilharzia regenti TaxID=157069 RepID=A0AA85JX41_TRIRE|nr:unnamed protein product [Trichobilharzia regenti]